jgi:hypothetical protein
MRSLRQIVSILIVAVLTLSAVGLRLPLTSVAQAHDAQVQSADCGGCDKTDCGKNMPSCTMAVCMNACVVAVPSFEPLFLVYERAPVYSPRANDVHPAADRPPPLPPPIV